MKYLWLRILFFGLVGWFVPFDGPTARPFGDGMAEVAPMKVAPAPATGWRARSPIFAAAEVAAATEVDSPQASDRAGAGVDASAAPGDRKAGNRKASYLVVGSFRRMGDADRLAASLTGVPAAVAPAVVEENVYFRVVTGPFADDEMASARKRLAAAGIVESWAINLCTADLSGPPCAPR